MVRRTELFLFIASFVKFISSESLFDEDLYKNVLDNVTCGQQVWYMPPDIFDASTRIPQSVLLGSQGSLGNYRQCLSIAHSKYNSTIYGKYCIVSLPLNIPNLEALSSVALLEFNRSLVELIDLQKDITKDIQLFRSAVEIFTGSRTIGDLPAENGTLSWKLAACIPKTCKVHDVWGWLKEFNVQFQDQYCRLPNDKIFSTGDYIAVTIIVIIGVLTALSTGYDLYNMFVLEKDPAEMNKLLTSCSVYTNTRRILTFSSNPGSIDCLDGVRSISILWIVLSHSFAQAMNNIVLNMKTAVEWARSLEAVYMQAGVLAVDTFFLMSGLLVVYTSVRRLTPITLRKNIHLFYLHRYLRMFPLLAAAVLFQASLVHHIGDGPYWPAIAQNVEDCRNYWWSALLHIQNYFVDGHGICLTHTWYLSVDMQLYFLSPLVLYCVMSSRRLAWYALAGALSVSLLVTVIICYAKSFPGVSVLGLTPNQANIVKFFQEYYINTVTRSSPFFIGMILGYLLHIWHEDSIIIPKWGVAVGWISSLALGVGMMFCNSPGVEMTQFWMNFCNSFMRPLWALAVGWVVFACSMGYGGPVNWFLSLSLWKFLARVSYALYLFHYPIQTAMRLQSEVGLIVSQTSVLYQFFTDLSVSLMVAIILSILIEAPSSTLLKMVFRNDYREAAATEPAELESPSPEPANEPSTSRQNDIEL